MIDLHCHILPGIDDGPKTMADSMAIAAMAAERGTRVIAATPHVSDAYPYPSERPAELRDLLNKEIGASELDMRVVQGGEVALGRAFDLDAAAAARVALGGGPYVLLECSPNAMAANITHAVFHVQSLGFRVLLAHPERCPAFHARVNDLVELVRRGALCSVTASAFTGQFGRTVQRFAVEMHGAGLIHNVASDAHSVGRRSPDLREWREALRSSGLASAAADWMTGDVPAAILAGEDIPARPQTAQRGGFWQTLRKQAA